MLNSMAEFQTDIARHLEMMAAAYMKATNIPPEECELVVETLPDKMVYRFQRRQTLLDQESTQAPTSLNGEHYLPAGSGAHTP